MRKSSLFLTVLAALFLYLSYRLIEPFLLAIASAMVFAVVFHPVFRHILRYVRGRDLAAFLATVLILAMVIGPTALIGYVATGELRTAYRDLSQKTKQNGGWMHSVDLVIEKSTAFIEARTGIPAQELREGLQARLEKAATTALSFGSAMAASVGAIIAQAAIAFVTLFFFLRDGKRFMHAIVSRIPLPRDTVNEVLSQAQDSIVANMYGVLAVAAAQGTLTGLAVWWSGLPSPVLWGVMASAFSVIPVVGSAIVWIPAAIVLFATGHWGKGVFMLAWGAGVVGMVDNIVRPMVVSERTQLNPLMVFFSLLGGTQLFGLIGVFLGPVIVTVTLVLLDFWSKLPDTAEDQSADKEVSRAHTG